jgi:GNAT superfamily N-acetyltransferase
MFSIRAATFDEIRHVESLIDEFAGAYDPARYEHELAGRDVLSLVAVDDHGDLIGYKVGYGLDRDVFRSWFGGVAPHARRRGVATALREHQEAWAREHGYTRIRVGSKNEFPHMLRLLIGAGYEIVAVEDAPRGRRIIFDKQL